MAKEVCRSFRNRGECRWGDACTFEHSRGPPILPAPRAVAECFVWRESFSCEHGANCRFRHGDDDPRFPKGMKDMSTELCRNFKKGRCKLGEYCPRKHEGLAAAAPRCTASPAAAIRLPSATTAATAATAATTATATTASPGRGDDVESGHVGR